MHFLNRGALVLTPIKIDRTVRKSIYKDITKLSKKLYLHRYYINKLWKENPFEKYIKNQRIEHLFPRCALTACSMCCLGLGVPCTLNK